MKTIMPLIYARLDAADFKLLVEGKETVVQGQGREGNAAVMLILEDIGWGAMLALVRAAMERAVNQPERVDDPAVRAMAYRIKATQTTPIEDEPCIIPPGDPLRL